MRILELTLWDNPIYDIMGLGFPAKKENRFAKISHFLQKFCFILIHEKMRNFCEIRNAEMPEFSEKIRYLK